MFVFSKLCRYALYGELKLILTICAHFEIFRLKDCSTGLNYTKARYLWPGNRRSMKVIGKLFLFYKILTSRQPSYVILFSENLHCDKLFPLKVQVENGKICQISYVCGFDKR